MNLNAFLLRTFWSILIILALVACAELGVRWCLSCDGGCVEWRDPRIYTWRYSVGDRVVRQDNEDKLSARWNSLAVVPFTMGHPLLGWVDGLDSATLLPRGYREDAGKERFVLVGAGWKELGAGRLVEDDPVVRSGANLIDLSVPGYSMDQDLLLLERTLKHFHGGQVLLWIDVDRLDHLQRTFVGRPKPWYKPLPQGGELQGVPINTDVMDHLADEPADPGLYSYHLFRTLVLADTLMSPQAVQARESALQELSKRLLFMLVEQASESGVSLRVIMDQRATGAHADDRRWALEHVCNDHHVPFDVIPQQRADTPKKQREEMCAALARQAYYEWDFEADQDIAAMRSLRPEEQVAPDPLTVMMIKILNDTAWLDSVKEKALERKLSFKEMLRSDAQYSLDHYSN